MSFAKRSLFDSSEMGAGAFPIGAAGGDLSGTYPNPNVAKVNGKTVLLGGALTLSGAFATTLTVTNTTSLTLPTSGTLYGTASGSITSAQLATSLSDETGSGSLVFGTAPTLSNPIVGTQTQGDNSTKAASTAYTDLAVSNAIAGVNPATSVKAATTAASDTSGLTYNNGVAGIGAFFTGSVNTAFSCDGVTFTALNQRVLIKNDTQSPSGAFNGVYYVSQLQTGILPPILTRALDYDTPSDINNTGTIPVISGTVNANTSWLLTTTIATVGTDPLSYTQFSYAPSSIALLASPTFTGIPLAPTAGAGTNTTQIATTAFVKTALTSTTYTPVWSSSGTQPAIGNGTIKGQYLQRGDVVDFSITIVCGSTSTFGTGNYRFSLPVAMNTTNVTPTFLVKFFSNTTNLYYVGNTEVISSTTVACYLSGGASQFGPTIPTTWTAGNLTFMTISGTYFV